ncbi:MAG: FAD binding domain-containing protein, partial [bacterium]
MEVIYRPKTLKELDRIIRKNQMELTYLAGTTDIMVQEERWKVASNLIDLTSVNEIYQKLEISDHQVLIGAALPLAKIISNQTIQK